MSKYLRGKKKMPKEWSEDEKRFGPKPTMKFEIGKPNHEWHAWHKLTGDYARMENSKKRLTRRLLELKKYLEKPRKKNEYHTKIYELFHGVMRTYDDAQSHKVQYLRYTNYIEFETLDWTCAELVEARNKWLLSRGKKWCVQQDAATEERKRRERIRKAREKEAEMKKRLKDTKKVPGGAEWIDVTDEVFDQLIAKSKRAEAEKKRIDDIYNS